MSAIVSALEERFRKISLALYDTSIHPRVLEHEVVPYLDDEVLFVDPWQSEKGIKKYRLGAAGFHAMFKFDFEIRQLSVNLDASGTRGRALIEGVMMLRQFAPLFTYPLRTFLVYEFNLEGEHPRIYRHEELWSFGDMLENAPLLGPIYARVFRKAFAAGFLGASYLAARLRGMLPDQASARGAR